MVNPALTITEMEIIDPTLTETMVFAETVLRLHQHNIGHTASDSGTPE